ncbi:MAG: hypothetical protein IT304_10030 [Dehalococcoidia bacterium]|nr:hypothetical protein [Dehalococcoidia bacterium]
MATADDGYLWPFQEHAVAWQLNHGVRMLLVDTHYWSDNRDAEAFAARLGPDAAATVRVATNASGPPQPGVYLCHVACALGHTPLNTALGEIRAFLTSHPREVMGVFFQDAASAGDTERAFAESGLLPYVVTHLAGAPWPTLGQMIADGHRLVVFAETGGAPPAWYQHGWDTVQDTRFDVHDPAQFSCALNRGRASNSLFLLNQWVAKLVPDPADAARVNAYDFLLGRARQCMHERGRLPNFIAVNFAEQGDLLRVVDALNGVEAPPGALARK